MSSFGTLFRVSTFGESHCKGVGAIIDGCPARLKLTEADIQPQLTRRRPGQSVLTTPRDEADKVTILSGTERGITLGTPIGLFVPNQNVRPGDYTEMNTVPRPGHAEYTYELKYGTRAASGGGRSSARETIGRVAAGAVAEKWLRESFGTEIVCFVSSIGHVDLPQEGLCKPDGSPWTRAEVDARGTLQMLMRGAWRKVGTEECEGQKDKQKELQTKLDADAEKEFLAAPESDSTAAYVDVDGIYYDRNGNVVDAPPNAAALLSDNVMPLRCPHAATAAKMATLIREVKSSKDSIGGVVTCVCTGVPPGLGEPCFDKLEAKLAHAMLSLPATKGFEIGSGFAGTRMRGSEHNDQFKKGEVCDGKQLLATTSNHAGGTLGGISHGADIHFRVPIKPVSTIGQAQQTVSFDGSDATLEARGRHDPCVLPRTPPLVEGMSALVLIDAALMQGARCGAGTTVHPGMLQGDGGPPEDEPAAKKARR